MNEILRSSFDLEQGILSTWTILDDISTLNESILENDRVTKDDIANILIGLTTLYEMKFDKSFRTFETVHGGLCKQDKLLESVTAINRELVSTVEDLKARLASQKNKPAVKKPKGKLKPTVVDPAVVEPKITKLIKAGKPKEPQFY